MAGASCLRKGGTLVLGGIHMRATGGAANPNGIRAAMADLVGGSAAGWQPIATAPKDGTEVLLFGAGRTWIDAADPSASHWMPLPAAALLLPAERGQGET